MTVEDLAPPTPLPDQSPPSECPRCTRLNAEIEPLLDRCRDEIHEQIRVVKNTSEKEILAIGDSVQSIVNNTRQYIEESKDAVVKNFADQGLSLSDYLTFTKQATETQENTVKEALTLSDNITHAGMAVDKLAKQSRLLALNAKIEASRLGDSGNAFSVITEEMNHLSLEIARTNAMIAESTQAIRDCLPKLVENSAVQMERLEGFSQTMHELKNSIEESISSTSNAGDSRINQILNMAYDVLSHLQFQDPMIQSVQRIDSLMMRLRNEVSKTMGTTDDPGLERFPNTAAPQAITEEQRNDSVDGPDAGEVMLF